MACYSPHFMFWSGRYTAKGKKDYFFRNDRLTLFYNGREQKVDFLPVSMLYNNEKDVLIQRDGFALATQRLIDAGIAKLIPPYGVCLTDMVRVPCGKCLGCRMARSREWALRCMLEAKQYEHNYFLTLTYDDAHLPEDHMLHREHLTKFLKDLRRYFEYHYKENGIRYFGCGEYGEKFCRPHYHLILFNCNIRDLKVWKCNFKKQKLYLSEVIKKIWNRGFISIGEVTYESCAYTARYVLKKQNNKFYEDNLITPEFVGMSTHPGIAYQYYIDNQFKIYKNDEIIILKGEDVLKAKPPHYFDRLYEEVDEDYVSYIKANRKYVAECIEKEKLLLLKCDLDTLLAKELELKSQSVSHLIRGLEKRL